MTAKWLVLLGVIGWLSSCGPGPDVQQAASIQQTWGIAPLGVKLTAAGYALDFRYHVLDAKRASPIVVRGPGREPKVIVEKSGAVLHVPFSEKVGSMRQSVRSENMIKPGKKYFVLFANPGRHVKLGDLVTIVIGDFRQEHVLVQ